MDFLAGELVDGVLPVPRLDYRVTLAPECYADYRPDGGGVVHDHDRFGHCNFLIHAFD
jgi:hypothetical protein